MLKRSWLQALCAAVCVLAVSGCGGDECTTAAECPNEKGPPPAGKQYACVLNKCELRDITPQADCTPECASGEFCDTSSGSGVCRTCSATEGCTAPEVCDTAANGGKGVCKACVDSGTGTDLGCSGTTPVCDPAGGGGAGVCRACLDSATGTDIDQGCSASTPVCDPAAASGAGICKACQDTATGADLDLGCSASAPVCDPAAANGIGACKTCQDTDSGSGTDLGCDASEPFCNILASGGRGQCTACVDSVTGTGMDQGCTASEPLCDATANSGVGVCKACVDSAPGGGMDLGCGGATPICDTAAGGGAGVCKACLDSAMGNTADVGCGGATPICDATAASGTGECKVCVDSAAGIGTDVGCVAGTPLCDTAASAGAGACKLCLDTVAPGSPGDDLGCFSPTALCDTAASGGVGECRVCLTASNEGCAGSLTCNAEGTGCEGCVDDTSCAGSPTPICKAPPPVAVCVECLSSTDCSVATQPACDTATNLCGCTGDAECAAAAGTTDFCDTAARNGRGECKLCVIDDNCASIDPSKPFCDNQTACIECRTTADCALTQVCNSTSKACEAVPGVNPATTSGQIDAFLAAAPGSFDPPFVIENALVTYRRPTVGTDMAGFFLQAEANGPAMFVERDAGELQVGDRVTVSITQKEIRAGIDAATALASAPTIVSRGHPVRNLNTATPAGLAVDHSAKGTAELVDNLDEYESELVHLTGTIAGAAASLGSGHVGFQITTEGVTEGTNNFRLRLAATVAEQLDIVQGCQFTLTGPMWRFTPNENSNAAQPSSYFASDLTLDCPAPKLLQARALSSTEVQLTFDRHIDGATVQAADFTIDNGLTVTTATVDGRQVLLTTSEQIAAQGYSVNVDGEVKDLGGKTVDPAAKSASFAGYSPPPTGASLVINELDIDNPSTDTAEYIEIHNRGGEAADLSNVLLILVNGDTPAGTPRSEYLRFPLSAVKDADGASVTTLPPGGYIVAGSAAWLSITAFPEGTLRLEIAASGSSPGANIIQNGADGVGLVDDATGTLLDAVFYKGNDASFVGPEFDIDTSAGQQHLNFQEGDIALAIDVATGPGVLQRSPNGSDTNNNNFDFVFSATPTPGAPNE